MEVIMRDQKGNRRRTACSSTAAGARAALGPQPRGPEAAEAGPDARPAQLSSLEGRSSIQNGSFTAVFSNGLKGNHKS